MRRRAWRPEPRLLRSLAAAVWTRCATACATCLGSFRVRNRPNDRRRQFDPTFIQADQDLLRLADRLVQKRMSDDSHSAYRGHRARAKVRSSATSLNAWVWRSCRNGPPICFPCGSEETEHNIAGAFADARSQEAFLVFDEADSLLTDRRMAKRGWEISQVNEMLTWMESHRLPFACTTNFVEKLDPATLRRFTFKVKLDYLTTRPGSGNVPCLLQPSRPQRNSRLSRY